MKDLLTQRLTPANKAGDGPTLTMSLANDILKSQSSLISSFAKRSFNKEKQKRPLSQKSVFLDFFSFFFFFLTQANELYAMYFNRRNYLLCNKRFLHVYIVLKHSTNMHAGNPAKSSR